MNRETDALFSPGTSYHSINRADDQEPLLHSEKSINSKILLNSQIYVEFFNLCYNVRHCEGHEKNILQNVTGQFHPGKLTGIIGPSGAGKSSFLSIISGLRSPSTGIITVNGVLRKADKFRRTASFVQQEVALLSRLTTKETLWIAAHLKLGRPRNGQSFERVIDEVANQLLLVRCLDTMTEKLSGGEKKRLSIGVEIITNPAVLLLDEPTSGLDSSASNQIVSVISNIAKTGCTVVCSIHQPNSLMIDKFDDILVLAEGRSFFCGPKEDIFETYEEAGFICPPFHNIAEFVIEVVTGQRAGNLDKLYNTANSKCTDSKVQYRFPRTENSTLDVVADDRIAEDQGTRASSWQKQKVLLLRAIICTRRDNTMTKMRLTAHIIVGLLLGLVFHHFGSDASKIQSNIACLFFFILFLFFANAMPAVQMFPVEAAVFMREYLNNWYGLNPYYIAKVITDLPLQILGPTCFLAIAYSMTSQPFEWDRILQVWIVCILTTILAQSLGIAAGAIFDSHAGSFLVPAFNIPQFLFAGFFLKLSEVPSYMKFLSTISYFRYGYGGMLEAIYGNDREINECSVENCQPVTGKAVLIDCGMPSDSFTTITLALAAWILILHITIYSVLRWKLYRATK